MTTLDDLEAVIRRELTSVVGPFIRQPRRVAAAGATTRMNAATDAILAGATAYALAEYGITAERRAELAALSRTQCPDAVHYRPGAGPPVCGTVALVNLGRHQYTTNPALTTCGRCKNTRAWKAAA